jgi:hypothetical protein
MNWDYFIANAEEVNFLFQKVSWIFSLFQRVILNKLHSNFFAYLEVSRRPNLTRGQIRTFSVGSYYAKDYSPGHGRLFCSCRDAG